MVGKNEMVKNYIISLAKQINEQYSGFISKDKVAKAIEMFKYSSDSYEDIIKKIDDLVQTAIANYIEEQRRRFDPKLVENNHREIYDKLEMLVRKLNENQVDYQLAGALCSYIKYGCESKRTHDDIDINLNEDDIAKFEKICEEMGLRFQDNRLNSPRVLKNGIPSGEHEVIATLDGTDFHIGAFCFKRMSNGTVINKGYYHDENNLPCCRNDIISPELANEIFGREQVDFRGQKLYITPPEYVYRLKNYTRNAKDMVDLDFMKDKIDKDKLLKINRLSLNSHTELVKLDVQQSIGRAR